MSLFLFQLAQIRWSNPALSSAVRSLRGWEYFQLVLPDFVTLGLVIGVVVFFFVFMIGAVQWMTAGADKAALESARKKIVNAIVGLIILLLLFLILQLFNLVFGIDIGNIGTPTGPGNGGGGTPTPGGPGGACTCQNWTVTNSNCSSGFVAQCVSPTSCECRANPLCYSPSVDYWRGCSDTSSFICNAPNTLICNPPTAACSSFWGPGAQCCICVQAGDPLPPGVGGSPTSGAGTPTPTPGTGGRFWNFDCTTGCSAMAGSGNNLETIPRYDTGPCSGQPAGNCTFDSRSTYIDPSNGHLIESITANF